MLQERIVGPEHKATLINACDLCGALIEAEDFVGCKQLMRENSLLEKIGRTFGSDSLQNLVLRRRQARALYEPSGAPLGDIRRAVEILEDLSPRSSRVLGPLDPFPRRIQDSLDAAREKLAQAEAPVALRTRSSKAGES